ncbi:hypothetical protein PanWU01x14_170800, partial [Parasponia andersonii]
PSIFSKLGGPLAIWLGTILGLLFSVVISLLALSGFCTERQLRGIFICSTSQENISL